MELNKYQLLDKEALARHEIHYNEIGSMHLRAQILDTVLDELIKLVKNNVALGDVRHFALEWWRPLSFATKFYRTIEWLRSQKRDTTEKHPDNLTDKEIEDIYLLRHCA